MQGTHSWANKNKPISGSSTTNVVIPPAASNQRANKVGTSAMRSQSKDRRLVGNKGKVTGKPKSPCKDNGGSTSFNFAGSFNSNDLIKGFESQ
jgi:hypothetical protein